MIEQGDPAFDAWEKYEGSQAIVFADDAFAAGYEAGLKKNKSALDLMRSLSINPTIPEGLRIMMKESLDRG